MTRKTLKPGHKEVYAPGDKVCCTIRASDGNRMHNRYITSHVVSSDVKSTRVKYGKGELEVLTKDVVLMHPILLNIQTRAISLKGNKCRSTSTQHKA